MPLYDSPMITAAPLAWHFPVLSPEARTFPRPGHPMTAQGSCTAPSSSLGRSLLPGLPNHPRLLTEQSTGKQEGCWVEAGLRYPRHVCPVPFLRWGHGSKKESGLARLYNSSEMGLGSEGPPVHSSAVCTLQGGAAGPALPSLGLQMSAIDWGQPNTEARPCGALGEPDFGGEQAGGP